VTSPTRGHLPRLGHPQTTFHCPQHPPCRLTHHTGTLIPGKLSSWTTLSWASQSPPSGKYTTAAGEHPSFPRFRRDKEAENVNRVTPLLGNSPPSNITFTNACMTAHMALASSPRYTIQAAPDTHTLHKTYKLLVAHLNRIGIQILPTY
jgi:hypothetical protein